MFAVIKKCRLISSCSNQTCSNQRFAIASLLITLGLCIIQILYERIDSRIHATMQVDSVTIQSMTEDPTLQTFKNSNIERKQLEQEIRNDLKLGRLKQQVFWLQQSMWHNASTSNKSKGKEESLLVKVNTLFNKMESLQKASKIDHLQYIKHAEKIVQRRIEELQNPEDCQAVRNLVCVMDAYSGLGSELHLLAECMFIALGTGRTLFVRLRHVGYASLRSVFEVITHPKCPFPSANRHVDWKGELLTHHGNTSKHTTVAYSTWMGKRPSTNFLPFSLPKSILDLLSGHHEDPLAWWVGQIMKYTTKVRAHYAFAIERAKRRIGFTHPIVGMHVRRSDKLSSGEATFNNLTEYMRRISDWYDRYDVKRRRNATRRVFLATDSYTVLVDAKKRFPSFVFLHDPLKAIHSLISTRFTHHSLIAVLTDIKILSECDYFVGTYSSNIGRLVYELMQAEGDRTFDSVSLDQIYHYNRIYMIWSVALSDHVSTNKEEITFFIGDEILIDVLRSNQYLGYGKHDSTEKEGYFPMVKVKIKPTIAPYPGF